MIPKPNSSQLMDKFRQLQRDIADIKSDMTNVEDQISTKMQIIEIYNAIAQEEALQIGNGQRKENDIYFSLDADNKIVGGQYDIYGQTIHSPFKAIPEQMFNFITDNGPLYKDCASVYFLKDDVTWNQENGYKYDFCNILKHESDLSKKDVYQTFSDEWITLRVRLNHTNFYGNTACNMIELCPYFPGKFDIQDIKIFSVTQYLAEGDDLDDLGSIPDTEKGSITLSKDKENESDAYAPPYMKNVGACRFLLPDTYQIYQIDFKIRIHKVYDTYPFGLRHLYFYNAKIDTVNDYVVAVIEKDSYIESIGNTVSIGTPTGEYSNIQASQNNIEYYMAYDNGMLQHKIEASDILSRNLKKIYVKIPLFDCLTYIEFKDISLR